jgi:GLPGLI family protein
MQRITLLLIFVFSVCYSQEVKVTYQAVYMDLNDQQIAEMKNDLALSDFQIEGFTASYNRIVSDVRDQSIILTTKGRFGYKLELPAAMDSDFDFSSSSACHALDLFEYMYSYDNKYSIAYSASEPHAVNFDSDNIIWNIRNDTKQILGYKCYKAELNYKDGRYNGTFRNLKNVWFTPVLDKSGGPIVYPGIPGLILEVQNDQYTITAVKLTTIKSFEFEHSNKKMLSEIEYVNLMKQTSKSIEARIKN